MTVLNHSVDLGNQLEHEHPLPAEVGGGYDPGMSQELVGSLYDAMAKSVWDVQAADLRAVLSAGHSPQLGGGILLERG